MGFISAALHIGCYTLFSLLSSLPLARSLPNWFLLLLPPVSIFHYCLHFSHPLRSIYPFTFVICACARAHTHTQISTHTHTQNFKSSFPMGKSKGERSFDSDVGFLRRHHLGLFFLRTTSEIGFLVRSWKSVGKAISLPLFVVRSHLFVSDCPDLK